MSTLVGRRLARKRAPSPLKMRSPHFTISTIATSGHKKPLYWENDEYKKPVEGYNNNDCTMR